MPQQCPLCGPEKRVGFDVRSSSARADTTHFIFDEKFPDKGSAEADKRSAVEMGQKYTRGVMRGGLSENTRTLRFEEYQNVQGKEAHHVGCSRKWRCVSCP